MIVLPVALRKQLELAIGKEIPAVTVQSQLLVEIRRIFHERFEELVHISFLNRDVITDDLLLETGMRDSPMFSELGPVLEEDSELG